MFKRTSLPSLNSLTHSSCPDFGVPKFAKIDMQIAGMDFREALMIFETPQQGIGADHPDMYIANAVGLLFLLNWAAEQAQTMRGSRIKLCRYVMPRSCLLFQN